MIIGEALSVPSNHIASQNHSAKAIVNNEHAKRKSPAKELKCSVLSYEKMGPDEMKCRLGFVSLHHILSFVATAYVGNIEVMTNEKHPSLTWLEQWFVHVERVHGENLCRWIDVASE